MTKYPLPIYKMIVQRTEKPCSGLVVIRKVRTIFNEFRTNNWDYYDVFAVIPYQSKTERRAILKRIMYKHRIVSIIPDIVETFTHSNSCTLLT